MFGWIFSEFNIRKRHFLFSSNDIVRYGGKVNSLNSSIILEVGVRMVRKKHVVGRRVLSILLCMLIVLCTVPMIAIAAADGAGVKVIERSKPLLYVYRNIAERYQPEAVKTQTPLSSYPLVVTGAVLRMATEQGGWDQTGTYKHTVLKAEWGMKLFGLL